MNDKLPFRAINYWLFGIGCLLLVIGFVLSAVAPWDGALSLTLAPLALCAAYLVVLPAALLWKSKGD